MITIRLSWLSILLTTISITVTIAASPSSKNAYSKSTSFRAKKLALAEEALVTAVEDKILEDDKNQFEACFIELGSYLQNYYKDAAVLKSKRGNEKAEGVANNGLLTLKMLHRLVRGLFTLTTEDGICAILNQTVDDTFFNVNTKKPSAKDLDEALEGTLTIQFIHGFDADTELSVGTFGDVDTGVVLDFETCMSLARKAASMESYAFVYQWLTAAAELAHADDQTKQVETAWTELMTLSNPKSLEDFKDMYHNNIPITLKGHDPLKYKDYRGCRGELGATSKLTRRDESCYYHYKGHPYLLIDPVRIEVLSMDPPVLQIYNVVSKRNLKHLQKGNEEQIVRNAIDRTLGMAVGVQLAESVKGVNPMTHLFYGASGKTKDIHFNIPFPERSKWTGDIKFKLAMFLVHLTEVEIGGHTAFPYLGVYARPIPGSLVFWNNVDKYKGARTKPGVVNCPVVLGTKHVLLLQELLLEVKRVSAKVCKPDEFEKMYG